MTIPSKFQINDEVHLKWEHLDCAAKVVAVRFTESKVSYDLEFGDDKDVLLDIESDYVSEKQL